MAFLIALVNASLGVSILAAGCVALAVSSFLCTGVETIRQPLNQWPKACGEDCHFLYLGLDFGAMISEGLN